MVMQQFAVIHGMYSYRMCLRNFSISTKANQLSQRRTKPSTNKMLSRNSRFFVLSEVNCWHILYIINGCAIYFSIARKSTLFRMMFHEILLLGIRLVLITCVNHGSNSLFFFSFCQIWCSCENLDVLCQKFYDSLKEKTKKFEKKFKFKSFKITTFLCTWFN